jgi:archaemetzincin
MHTYGLSLTVLMWLAAAVGVAAGVRAGLDFTPPDAAERRRAIGPMDDLPPLLRRALEPDDHFQPIDPPGPHDWLANHPERGQTFAQFVASKPNRPDKRRRTIYLLPLGAFDSERSPPLDQLEQFTEAYFMMPVKRLPAVKLGSARITDRINPHTRNRQLLTGDVLKLLKKRLPKDAYCLLGITMEDLYPDDSWNFVFG